MSPLPQPAPGTLRAFVRRHILWAALLAVLVPLAVLLGLQYRSLVRLEHLSGVAHRASLDNYLEAVRSEVQYFYESAAERALNLPASVFTESRWDTAGFHFKKKAVEGARVLFLVSFLEGDWERLVFFDSSGERVAVDPYSPEYRAIYVASTSWSVLGRKGLPVGPVSLAIDERDPENRIVLNPITQPIDADTARIVGLAGMVVDPEWFREELLPRVIDRALPAFFSDDAQADQAARPTVTVRDGAGELVYASRPPSGGTRPPVALAPEDASRSLPFVFTDWRVGLVADPAGAARLARASFLLNAGLTAVIALVLLAGVALALRTAARAVRLAEMKSDFVSNVSHELRTPVSSIRAFGELLALGRADEAKVREYGERIEGESRRLTALIQNILDFSRLESGDRSLRLEPADAGEVVAGALDGFRSRLEQKGFRVDFRRPAAPLPVRADVAALGQVVSNLLDNAVKYSGEAREIEVAVEGAEAARGVPWATIAVRDRGIGIPREEQGRIFERFHRVSSSLVHDVKGSGLGLALVDRIVGAHGGRVTVESEPGKGSTFTVWLPLDEAAEPGSEAMGHLVGGET